MVVELRTLRITSDFDAGRYVAGMAQKVDADKAGAQSSKAVGTAIDDVKIKVSSAVPLIERLSRTYIDGYGSAAKFNSELLKLARSQDTNATSVEHLELIYGGLQKKFGLIADATELASKGYGRLASAIENVNSRLNAQGDSTAITALTARMEQLRSQFDPTFVAAQRLSSELNDLAEAERLGVQITGGYERALEALTVKHDAAAAAAKRQRDEYARLAQEGREALSADRSQAAINATLGVGAGNGLRASDSAQVFAEQLGRQEEIARLRAQQEASNFASDLNQRFSINGRGSSAQASASVFSEAFSRQDELDRLRAQQQGALFQTNLNERLGVNGYGTSARESASAFEDAAREAEALSRRINDLRTNIDPTFASAQKLTAELDDLVEAERLGIQITGGYEAALDRIILKHDAVAMAAKKQADEYSRLATEARDAQAADAAQARFNGLLGVGNSTGLRASDSAAFISDEFSRREEIAKLRSQQQGTAFTSDLNQRLGVNGFGTSARASAGAFEEAARSAEELDRKVAAVRAQIDPLSTAQNRLNAELAEYDALASQGAISSIELAKAQALARERYDTYAGEMQRQQKKGVGGLPSYQLTNLMYQGTDVFQSFALGMPAMQVILQQGPQIAQIFAANSMATKAFISSLGLTTVAITGTVAAVALGAKAFNDYLVSIKEVETAAAGLGRGTAGTASQMEAAAQAGADAADISVKSARAMEVQFLRTGRIGSEHFEGLIGLSKNFAATIGIDASDAGSKLSEMFADPAKAAQQLYRQYGLLDASTAEYVQRLTAQNRTSEAQQVLLNALPQRLADASQATTALGRAWDSVASSAGNAWDAMGKAIDRALSGPSAEERIANLGRQANAPRVRGREAIQAELTDAIEQQRRQQQLQMSQAQRAQDARLSGPALDTASGSSATAEARRRRELEDQAATLQSGMGARFISDDQRADLSRTYDATTRALQTLIPEQEKAQRLAEIDIRIASERNPLLRANLSAERERIQLAGEVVTTATAEARIAQARNQAIQETIASATVQNAEMRDEVETRRRLSSLIASGSITQTDANRMLQQEAALRPLVVAAAAAEGQEKQRLQSVIDGLRGSYADLAAEEKAAAARSAIRSQNDQIETLRAEIGLVGQSAKVRQQALVLLQAEQQIRREGWTGREADDLRANAKRIADQTLDVERLRDAWGEVQTAIEGVVNSGVDKLIEGDWSGALDAVKKEIVGGLTQIGIKNPLTNALDGGNRGTISDVGGLSGIVDRLFGGAAKSPESVVSSAMQSVGSMMVQATSVVVNGGIGGDVSRLLNPANSNNAAGLLGGTGGAGSALSFVGNYKGAGVDPRLTDILNLAAQQTPGFKVDAISGYRAGDPRFHGKGMATDVQLTDLASGKLLGNYQDASSFSAYEKFAQTARQIQMAKYPELADQFRWGGYFGGGKGKYGALDTMHFDVAGKGMAGGSWDTGLTSAQKALWPGIESQGNAATKALQNLAGQGNVAAQGLGSLGTGLDKFGSTLSSASAGGGSSGGGLFGWLKGLFGGSTQFAAAAAGTLKPGLFSDGGWTGPGGVNEPRGIVHAGEVVWSQQDVARAGGVAVVDGMRLGLRGYAAGGSPDARPVYRSVSSNAAAHGTAGAGGSSVSIAVNNYSGQEVRTEETTDSRGNRQVTMVIGQQAAGAIKQRGNPARQAIQSEFAVKTRGISR